MELREKARATAVHRRGQAGGEAGILTTPRRGISVAVKEVTCQGPRLRITM